MSHHGLVVRFLSRVVGDPSVADAAIGLYYEDRALGHCVPGDNKIVESNAVGIDSLAVNIREQWE